MARLVNTVAQKWLERIIILSFLLLIGLAVGLIVESTYQIPNKQFVMMAIGSAISSAIFSMVFDGKLTNLQNKFVFIVILTLCMFTGICYANIRIIDMRTALVILYEIFAGSIIGHVVFEIIQKNRESAGQAAMHHDKESKRRERNEELINKLQEKQ